MTAYARRAWIVLWKDLLTERRSKERVNALFFFALLLLFLFQFALGPDPRGLRAALPGLFWLGVVLAGLLGLGRAFLTERDNDCWEGLLLTPGDKSAIYLGKLLGSLALMGLVEIVLLALFGVFYGVELWSVLGPLAVVMGLGTIGLANVGTLFAAMTTPRDGPRGGAARRRKPLAQAPDRGRRRLPRGRAPDLRVRPRCMNVRLEAQWDTA
jgi:heme exporter protein B